MSGEFSFVVARLESDELNSFSTVDFPSFLMSIERTSGKAGRSSLHLIHDGLRRIGCDERDLRADAGQLADRIQVENQIFLERHAPAREQRGERVIVGRL